MNDIKTFKDNLFTAAKAKGFTDYEIYMNGSDTFSVRVFKGEIQEFKNAGGRGISFRGTYNGNVGYAYTEMISADAVQFLIDNAAQNAEIIEAPDVEELYAGDKEYPEVKTYESALDEFPVNERINKALTMEKTAFEADSRVVGVDYCQVQSGGGYTYIANSLGMELSTKANYAFAFVNARVKEGEQVKMDGEQWVGHDWNAFSPEETAKKAVGYAVALLGAKPVPTGNYDIVLDYSQASSLLGTFWSIFNADDVQKGFSLLKGKLGEEIAASNITIRDDALLDYKLGSQPFDAEGVASCNKAVVENGVLKTFLHNTKTAKKDGVKSTGNGSKASYKSPLSISPGNLYIVPSETSKDDLVKEMANGLIITNLAGLHSGANRTSGDFSLSAGGFLVENGEIVHPVEQITVAGNFFSVLKNIVKAANDLDFGASSVASPSLWIKGISVSGS